MKNSHEAFVITIPIYNGIDLMDAAATMQYFPDPPVTGVIPG